MKKLNIADILKLRKDTITFKKVMEDDFIHGRDIYFRHNEFIGLRWGVKKNKEDTNKRLEEKP